jgi:glutamate-1-semialdehyde 2,1-aminomutase
VPTTPKPAATCRAGGRTALLDLTSAARPDGLSCSGTFNGNVITAVAGCAALAALDEPAIAMLNSRARSLAGQIEAAARRIGIPACVTHAGSVMHVHLLNRRPVTYEQATASPAAWGSALHLALLLEGIYTAPRGMLNLSTALDDDLLARVADGYAKAFERIRGLVTSGAR